MTMTQYVKCQHVEIQHGYYEQTHIINQISLSKILQELSVPYRSFHMQCRGYFYWTT